MPTRFDAAAAAENALQGASSMAGIALQELGGVVTTGIFKDVIQVPPLNVVGAVPEYAADAKGAWFLNRNSRSVIDIGGNIHKAISYDQNGDVLDVIQNDKCADGMGIFYTNMAKALGVNEEGLSELALQSKGSLSLAVQCSLSAETDAIDLLCQGREIADVANAVSRFVVERVADMCTTMDLKREVVVAGGLARSQALVRQLAGLLKQELSVLDRPEYAGAIGAVISNGGGE